MKRGTILAIDESREIGDELSNSLLLQVNFALENSLDSLKTADLTKVKTYSQYGSDTTSVGTQKCNSGPSVYNALVQDHASAHSVNIDEYRSTQSD